MKFSHQLALNSVPDWSGAYINYDQLKKQIYSIEKEQSAVKYAAIHDLEQGMEGSQDIRNLSNQGLNAISTNQQYTPESFIWMLDAELDRICAFYVKKEQEIFHTLDTLTLDISNTEKTYSHYVPHWEPLTSLVPSMQSSDPGPSHSTTYPPFTIFPSNKPSHPSPHTSPIPNGMKSTGPNSDSSDEEETNHRVIAVMEDDDEDEEEEEEEEESFPLLSASHSSLTSSTPMQHSFLQRNLWAQPVLKSQRTLLKRQLLQCYADLGDLHDYIKLNRTAFSKILKKFDKLVAPTPLRQAYLIKVNAAYPFSKDTSAVLEQKLLWNSELYTRVVTFGDAALAKAELQCLLREHITYERNTIWREMISKEREVLSLGVNKPHHTTTSHRFHVTLFGCTFLKLPRIFLKPLCFLFALVLFFALLHFDIFVDQNQQACFAVLVFVSWLWATETFPLFVTSLLIPFLLVLLRVLRDPYTSIQLDTHAATKYIFSTMFSPVIMLLLGGFSMAAALSKHHIAKLLAISLLKKAGTRSALVLLAIMLISSFASMWISNVASPVLCFSIIQVA